MVWYLKSESSVFFFFFFCKGHFFFFFWIAIFVCVWYPLFIRYWNELTFSRSFESFVLTFWGQLAQGSALFQSLSWSIIDSLQAAAILELKKGLGGRVLKLHLPVPMLQFYPSMLWAVMDNLHISHNALGMGANIRVLLIRNSSSHSSLVVNGFELPCLAAQCVLRDYVTNGNSLMRSWC